MVWVWIIEGCYSDDDVYENAQSTLEVIGLAVAQEVSSHDDSEDEDDSVEDFEIQILILSATTIESKPVHLPWPCAIPIRR